MCHFLCHELAAPLTILRRPATRAQAELIAVVGYQVLVAATVDHASRDEAIRRVLEQAQEGNPDAERSKCLKSLRWRTPTTRSMTVST